MRWVQDSSQCISTTVMPRQFVPDNPEIVSALHTCFALNLYCCVYYTAECNSHPWTAPSANK